MYVHAVELFSKALIFYARAAVALLEGNYDPLKAIHFWLKSGACSVRLDLFASE
jgi:hypothetical protein